jgi:hypothetical protein
MVIPAAGIRSFGNSNNIWNLSTVVAVLSEGCDVRLRSLPKVSTLSSSSSSKDTVHVQKHVLELRMDVWQIVGDQKRTELFAQKGA